MAGYDCVIVGSGASGGTVAYALAKKGCRVLLVESGDFVKPPAALESTDRIGFAQSEYGPSRSLPCVGGPTKFYGAALYRLREMDFESTRLETGESVAWPVSYKELAPYYSDAETIYSVHGSTAGDATEPPRTTPYPYPPIPHQGLVKSLVERIEATGVPVGHIPRGLDYRDGGKCVLCATCDGYYCRLDAKMDAEIACIRPALATGNVQLATNTACLRVLLSADGKRAIGVRLRSGSVESTVHADIVVVSAGVMDTPPLLRRSRTSAHPEGIGNYYGCLGRYLCGHSVAMMVIVMGLKPLPAMHTKTFAINSFYGPSSEWPYPQGSIQVVGQVPTFDQSAFIRAVLARSLLIQCMTEEPSSKDSGLTFVGDGVSPHVVRAPLCKRTLSRLARQATRIFRRAGCKVVLTRRVREMGWHGVGSARMGTDPRSSVLDSRSRVHGIDNLYVVDSSSLPSPGAVNTGLTLMALALRAADDIAGQRRVEPVAAKAESVPS
jgi:choline dehydrogenase-like flavoprotein